MSRYSVLYQFRKTYFQLPCETLAEARQTLRRLYTKKNKKPIGIYDAKTELFEWETVRQQQFNRLTVEEQGRLGNEMIAIVQQLRSREEHAGPSASELQPDILQRPVFLFHD
ncbi:hypothetical protein ACO2Q8_19015 [Larkinella sp. VNQ87]|uniref:hypothetical protein n=1 Tax=Larkinella sp. VNQ87 TaxID=3400921 RepID=UPI003BFDB53E